MLKPVNDGVVTTVFIVPNGLKPNANETAGYLFSWHNVVLYAYLLGVITFAAILLFKLFKLTQMTRSADTITNDRFKIVSLEGSNTAFSFFNYLFIGSKTTGSNIIIRHEMVHIRQKHTLDVLFLEIIKIINWFNPLVYLLQNSLKTVHEYIADEQTAAFENDTLAYSSFLVSNAYGLNGSPVTNSFFNYNLLKKRIIMLNQKRSGNLARLKYLVAVPICAAALCASTLGFSKTYALVDLAPQHVATDSAAKAKKQSKIQYLPPPIMVKNGYSELFTHLNKTEKYPGTELKNKQPGLVIVAFNLGADHKISNTRIVKSTGNAFSETVLASFKSFNGTVTDKAGEHKLAISFFTDYYGQASKYEADIQKSGAEFNTFVIGSLGYTVPPPPPPVPGSGKTPPVVKKPTYIGKQKMPPPPPPVPPASAANEIRINEPQPPVPAVKPNKAKMVDAKLMPPPPPPKDPFDSLYKYIARHVRYPAVARENHIGGRVILVVTITNGKIEDVKLTRSLTDETDDEVVRVLKNYDGPLGIKSGYYSLPVAFSLLDEHDNEVAHTPENYASKNKTKYIRGNGPQYSMNEIVIVGYAVKKP
jgi:outer membrane biosynthesis protein TonB